MQFSMSTSITQYCTWESCTKQNIDYPCISYCMYHRHIIRVCFCMHWVYQSMFIFDNTAKRSCYIIFFNTFLKQMAKMYIQICIYKNSEHLSVHCVMIYLFSSVNIYYFINFVWASLFYKIECFFFLIMAYRWSGEKQLTFVTLKSIFIPVNFHI